MCLQARLAVEVSTDLETVAITAQGFGEADGTDLSLGVGSAVVRLVQLGMQTFNLLFNLKGQNRSGNMTVSCLSKI